MNNLSKEDLLIEKAVVDHGCRIYRTQTATTTAEVDPEALDVGVIDLVEGQDLYKYQETVNVMSTTFKLEYKDFEKEGLTESELIKIIKNLSTKYNW